MHHKFDPKRYYNQPHKPKRKLKWDKIRLKAKKKAIKRAKWNKIQEQRINEITDNIDKTQINREVKHLMNLRGLANQKHLESKQQ